MTDSELAWVLLLFLINLIITVIIIRWTLRINKIVSTLEEIKKQDKILIQEEKEIKEVLYDIRDLIKEQLLNEDEDYH